MNLNNLVTVIITTYKRPYEMLERALRSVLTQSYSNIELIVVDDSSDDFIERDEIKNKIENIKDDRITYIQHKINQGVCAARNTGIRMCAGDYIAFLDDDDEYLPDKIKLQLEKIKKSDTGLVYCPSYTIRIIDNIEVKKTIRIYKFKGMVFETLISGNNFIGSTSFVMVKKEVFYTCGFFNIDVQSSNDLEMWLRISKKYKIDYVDVPLVNYYYHDSERISTNIHKKIQGIEKIIELNIDYLKSHPNILAVKKMRIAFYYKKNYGFKAALKKWFEAFWVYPFQLINIKYLRLIMIKK